MTKPYFELMVGMLHELGYRTLTANGGEKALAMLANEHGIALMLTDVVMPRMNGRVLADRARELKPELRILFATGNTRDAIVHNGVVDAGVELVTKPYTLEDLAIKLHRMLA
jgi:CheY-like chemotaxis protein